MRPGGLVASPAGAHAANAARFLRRDGGALVRVRVRVRISVRVMVRVRVRVSPILAYRE